MIIDKEDFKNAIKHLIYLLCLISTLIIVCLAIIIVYNKCTNHNSSPVEEINKIDSIKFENNKLTTEINILDSIKNNKVNDVTKLNNDSTIKLFYKLISTKQ